MTGRSTLARRLGTVALFLAVALVNLPVIVVILNAFKSATDITTQAFFPAHPTLHNFDVIKHSSFGRFMVNSFVVATAGTAIAVVAAISAGYALSRFRQPGLEAYSRLLLAVQMVPVVLTLLPLFLVLKQFSLIDSHLGLIIIYGAFLLPFSTWIARSFFDSIPKDLEEAAWMDGCGRLTTLVRVVAPLAAPGLVSIGILCFITAWNEYLLASVFLRSENLLTVGVGLQLYTSQNSTDWGPVMAGATVAMIPSVVVYLVFQRYFVSGALAGAVKG
jgi:ABC-type glycerol-3-phosphate transport system permease component